MKRLAKEFNALDIHSNKIELSEELSWLYEQAYSYKSLWREHYNYSMTDPRFLEADEATIYADFLQFSIKALGTGGLFKLRKKSDPNYNIKTAADLEAAILKDCENIRMNPDNYVTPEFLLEQEEEKERLWREYTQQKVAGRTDREIAEIMGERFQRYVDISRVNQKNIERFDKFANKNIDAEPRVQP